MSLTMDVERHKELLEMRHQQRQQEQTRPAFTATLLRSCMKQTELSMAELQHFRLSLFCRDPELDCSDEPSTELPNFYEMEEDNLVSGETQIDGIIYEPASDINEQNNNALEYEDPLTIKSDGKTDESLQCFVYCLYEQLGLIAKGVYMENELFAKLYAIVGRERHLVKECMNLNTNNKCESSYKMHLCYASLKILEEENRIRKILENAKDDQEREEILEAETAQETHAMEETEPTQSIFAYAEGAKTEEVGVEQ